VDGEAGLQAGVESTPAPDELQEAPERQVEGGEAPEGPEKPEVARVAEERGRNRDDQKRQLSGDLPGRPGGQRRERNGEERPPDEGRDRQVDRRDAAERPEKVAAGARGAGPPRDEGCERQSEAYVGDADAEGERRAEDEEREGRPLEAAATEDRGKQRLR